MILIRTIDEQKPPEITNVFKNVGISWFQLKIKALE